MKQVLSILKIRLFRKIKLNDSYFEEGRAPSLSPWLTVVDILRFLGCQIELDKLQLCVFPLLFLLSETETRRWNLVARSTQGSSASARKVEA